LNISGGERKKGREDLIEKQFLASGHADILGCTQRFNEKAFWLHVLEQLTFFAVNLPYLIWMHFK